MTPEFTCLVDFQNIYELCPPYTSHNTRPKQESGLITINLFDMNIRYRKAPPEFATASGSLQILSKNEENQLENLLIVGGTSERLDLFSTFDLSLQSCDLSPEYGGCIVSLGTRNKDTLECSARDCGRTVHLVCDKFTRGISKMTSERYKCPLCNDYDPVTKKKRPKRKNRGT